MAVAVVEVSVRSSDVRLRVGEGVSELSVASRPQFLSSSSTAVEPSLCERDEQRLGDEGCGSGEGERGYGGSAG